MPDPETTVKVAKALLDAGGRDRIRPAGLGARDSLRLEAGMCLYGHDLSEDTTPVEAGLSWVIGRDRRSGESNFHGSHVLLKQLKPKREGGGTLKKRVGLIVEGVPAREGAQIRTRDDQRAIGKVTSGGPSPTLGKNIAMGYVETGFNQAGTELQVRIRGKSRNAQVVKMPFLPSRYWKQTTTGTAPM